MFYVNSPCMASPAGQSNQIGLGLSGSVHEEAHLGLLSFAGYFSAFYRTLKLGE